MDNRKLEKLFENLLKEVIGPFFRQNGFKSNQQMFSRETDEVIQYVYCFQLPADDKHLFEIHFNFSFVRKGVLEDERDRWIKGFFLEEYIKPSTVPYPLLEQDRQHHLSGLRQDLEILLSLLDACTTLEALQQFCNK